MENNFLLLFTSYALCKWHIKHRLLHVLLQVTETKSEKGIVGESLIDDDIIETKKKRKKTKQRICLHHLWNIFHINFTICDIQFNALRSLLCKTQVRIIKMWKLWTLIQDKSWHHNSQQVPYGTTQANWGNTVFG